MQKAHTLRTFSSDFAAGNFSRKYACRSAAFDLKIEISHGKLVCKKLGFKNWKIINLEFLKLRKLLNSNIDKKILLKIPQINSVGSRRITKFLPEFRHGAL